MVLLATRLGQPGLFTQSRVLHGSPLYGRPGFDASSMPIVYETLKLVTEVECSMELRVIEKTDDELRMEIAGEDHTFMNVLKGALLETAGVAAATYDMNPEQSGGQTEPILSVKTEDGVDPLDAVGDAAGRVRELTDDFRTAFETAA
jgi:DNA-directed RNA polymerase subunit L